MKKIVKGNDFTLRIPVMKMVEGEPQAFPLPACTDVVVQVCNQFRRIPLAFTIDVKEDNVLLARVEGDKMSIGTYAIEVRGKIFGNDWRSNEYPQFSIVAKNADADTEFGETDEGDNSVEMDTAMVILPPTVELSDLISKTNEALKNNKETNDTLNTNEEARKKEEEARVIAEQKRTDAEQSRVAAETKRETDFATSKKACDDATNKALSTYSHPPYVDADGYYYKWNVLTGNYDKTDVNLTGKAFQIKKVFSSVSVMNATDVNTFAENDFVLINTVNVEDEDNAKLYVVALNEQGQKFYSYLVDMSGFRGFTGKTPQIVIGSVNTLAPGSSASASLVANGTDASGNPVYALNFAIPKGEKITLADLTEDEIKLLQKPANDAIVACNDATGKANAATSAANTAAAKANAAADDAISKSVEVGKLNSKVAADEEDRVRAESGRALAENERVDAETTRKQAETDRASAEDARVEAEQSRADAETKRESDFDTAIKTAETATTGAETCDVELSGSTISVTNRHGETKSVDVINTDEEVTVTIASSVESIKVADIKINVFLNNGKTPQSYTTNAEGKATFTIDRGNYYQVVFPEYSNAQPIAPQGYTAVLGSRNINVEYLPYDEDSMEKVIITATKYVENVGTAWEGIPVIVTVDRKATTYQTDAKGQVTVFVPYKKEYTVRIDNQDGYNVSFNKNSRTNTANVPQRLIDYRFYQFKAGIFVVDANKNEYYIEDWVAAGKNADDAVAIKVADASLSINHGTFCIRTSDIKNVSQLVSKQWCTQNLQFDSIALNGNNVKDANYYNGESSSYLIRQEAQERSLSVPAFDYAYDQIFTIGGEELHGFLMSIGQEYVHVANIGIIRQVLETLYGEEVATNYYNFVMKKNRWTSTQFSAKYAWYYSSSADNYIKSLSYVVLPVYAC